MLNYDERHLSMSKLFRSDDLGPGLQIHHQYEPDTSTICDDTDTFDTTDQNISDQHSSMTYDFFISTSTRIIKM